MVRPARSSDSIVAGRERWGPFRRRDANRAPIGSVNVFHIGSHCGDRGRHRFRDRLTSALAAISCSSMTGVLLAIDIFAAVAWCSPQDDTTKPVTPEIRGTGLESRIGLDRLLSSTREISLGANASQNVTLEVADPRH